MYEDNAFLTLTYDDAHLPDPPSLDKTAFPGFMKRLRSRFEGQRIRYFHCGEYGDRSERPHYHACVFGFDFPDKEFWHDRKGYPVWRSDTLESLWPFGFSEIGSVTFESAAYVARYICKKVTGPGAKAAYERVDVTTGELFQLEPEYVTMSRRPGIGAGWFEKFKSDVFPSDEVVVRGKVAKPPRYYDLAFEREDPEGFALVASARRRGADLGERTPERLAAKELFTAAKMKTFSRREL